MKVLFVGLGSIGARHLKNLWAACEAKGACPEVTALRSAPRVLGEELAPLVMREVQTLPENESWDIAFVTGPTHLHAQTLEMLKGRAGAFFIEKPVFQNANHDLDKIGLQPGQKAYVAAPMRWCGTYLALRKALDGLPVYSVRAICSSYLPDWRPAADYRTVYSARREMGGGVTLDLIHEWDYLADLFGLPEKSYNLRGTYSQLEVSSDDISVYIAQYPRFLCEVHLDYFGRAYRRTLEVFSEEGTLTADFGRGTLTLPDGTVQDCTEPVNRRYEREMEYFLQYAAGDAAESVNSPAHALRVLQLAESPCWPPRA